MIRFSASNPDEFCEIFDKIFGTNSFKAVTAKEELEEYNIMKEYEALERFLKMDLQPKDRLYKSARYKILKYIITCAENDPVNGDYYSEENKNLIKEAGMELYQEGGEDSLN